VAGQVDGQCGQNEVVVVNETVGRQIVERIDHPEPQCPHRVEIAHVARRRRIASATSGKARSSTR
jgi:hypothetical protein